MAEIFDALAAQALSNLGRVKDRGAARGQEEDEYARQVVDFLRRAEDHMRLNEYTWLIKGFYEIRQGKWLDSCASACSVSCDVAVIPCTV
jgi:hypothetical protein